MEKNILIGYRPLFLKKGKRLVSVNPLDILFVEAADDFVKVATCGDKQLFSCTMNEIERQLHQGIFIRVHRSYIVNLRHVKYIEGGIINLGSIEIPIHKTYSDEFFRQLFS